MTPILGPGGVEATATISDDGVYRYDLTRKWAPGSFAMFVMLNPSTADAERDDPTIRRCMGFARSMGMGGIVVCNLFAYRATRPSDLGIAPDPIIGPENDDTIDRWARDERVRWVIAAWGAHSYASRRGDEVASLICMHRGTVFCLGRTQQGYPRHPLYVPKDTLPVPWMAEVQPR
jgi:hypothetical protein